MSLPRPSGPPGAHFEAMGITAELLRKVMSAALSRGAEDADLYFQHRESVSVSLSDRKVNQATTHVDLGMGVRAVVGDQVGYAYSEDLREEALIAAALTAAEIAATSNRRDVAPIRARALPNHYPVERPWDEVGMARRVELVRAWEQAALGRDPRIRRVESYLADGTAIIMVVRPDGRLVEDWRPMTIGNVRCTAQSGSSTESSSFAVAGRAGLEFYGEERQARLVQEAADRTLFLMEAEPAPVGEMPIVLAAGPSAILLHEAIGHGMEADFNRKRTSIYAESMGQRIADEQVTIVDDGTVAGSRGAINVDDEGNESQRTVLVEKGVLRSYLHDEISARHYKVAPTGSGRREDFRRPPLPRMRATLMLNGEHAPEDIIRSVDRGLYCLSFGNGQVHIGGGDFSFYMRQGWLIEGGRLTRPVKDCNIIGNGPRALAAIDMVGNDFTIDEGGWTCGKDGQGVPVSQGMPTVRVQKLVVGGAGR